MMLDAAVRPHSLSDMGTHTQPAVTFRCLLPATSLPAPLLPVCHHNLPSINEPDFPLSAVWLCHCSQQVPLVLFSEFLQLQQPGRAASAAQRGFVYSSLDSPLPELSSHISAASSTKSSQLE